MIPGVPHYFLQCGKPGQIVFCTDREREMFLRLLARNSERFGLRVMAYCLLADRYGLVAVPQTVDAPARALARVHSDYARVVLLDRDARGAMWKERYESTPLNSGEYGRVVAEIERSPIDAGPVRLSEFHRWLGAAAWRRVLRGGENVLAGAVASTLSVCAFCSFLG